MHPKQLQHRSSRNLRSLERKGADEAAKPSLSPLRPQLRLAFPSFALREGAHGHCGCGEKVGSGGGEILVEWSYRTAGVP
jgi:hypothetical protein